MSFDELRAEIERRKINEDPTPVATELHKKIALSFSTLAFVLVALPLAIKTKRGEKSVGFGISLAIIIIYGIILAGGEALALKHIMPPLFSMWLPNLTLFIAGGILIILTAER